MNAELLKKEVQEWLNQHKNDPLHTLAFKKSPFTNISIQDLLTQISGKKKLKNKVKFLTTRNDILFPPSLNLEQSSSWETAQYKAKLFSNVETVVDLTGGFGIDSIAFSKTSKTVIHLEPNLDLQAIAQHNFKTLDLNIQSYPLTAEEFINKKNQHNYFYLDPSRRDVNQNKVFLLSELNPNPITILNKLEHFKKLVIKLSPLYDLSALVENFPQAKIIHIIALKNEVKEILVEINHDNQKDLMIKAVNLLTNDTDYTYQWGNSYKPKALSELKKFIYEPNAAIQKTQNFLGLEAQFKISKLAINTNLWTSDELFLDFPGKVYKFLKPIKNLKKELKNESIQVIHRNFPENLQLLKKRYKFKTDGVKPVIFTSDTQKALSFWAEKLR